MSDQPLLFQVRGPANFLYSALTPNHVTGALPYLLAVVNTKRIAKGILAGAISFHSHPAM